MLASVAFVVVERLATTFSRKILKGGLPVVILKCKKSSNESDKSEEFGRWFSDELIRFTTVRQSSLGRKYDGYLHI